jgi:hypothetical protein
MLLAVGLPVIKMPETVLPVFGFALSVKPPRSYTMGPEMEELMVMAGLSAGHVKFDVTL